MEISATQNLLFKEDTAAKYLGFSVRSLQAWRCRGGGPKFVKISARAVRYRQSDLDRWAASRVIENTSQNVSNEDIAKE